MNQLKLRVAYPEDTKQIIDWMNKNRKNVYDPDILKYPTLRVLCAYDYVPVSYLPTQKVLMLESVAPNPNASDPMRAQALRDLVKGSELLASSDGIKEICFFGTDESVIKIATDHGFERIAWPLMRLKL